MTGPEHHREAEKLLEKSVTTEDIADDGGDRAATGRSSTRANAWGKVL